MGKKIEDAVHDAMLAEAEGTTIAITAGEPANFAAVSGITLATQAISGSYTKANGDVSGRKNTTPAQTGLSITSDGTADHVVEHDGSAIKKVTTCTAQALTSGGTVDIPAYDHEIQDPT